MDYRVVSIGALSKHPLWPGDPGGRAPRATCSLIRSGDAVILVDPGLPALAQAAALRERSGLSPQAITHVFLTNFRPAHRAGLAAFPNAVWWISESEREIVGGHFVQRLLEEQEDDVRDLLQQDIAILQRCQPAPDRLAPGVDLFPLPGYTPGGAGLLLCLPTATVLVAGDAVATSEHLAVGRVLEHGYDLEQSRESLIEAMEIADLIIPGHDNLTANRGRR